MTDTITRAGPCPIRLDRTELLQLEKCLTREWLETNGRGGYASLTALMCPTRRYHGLLVTPVPGSVKRYVFVTRFEEFLHGPGRSFPLSMARYPGEWSPVGHRSIATMELVPYPSARYRIGHTDIVRDVLMVRGEPTVLCRYHITGTDPGIDLRLQPLLACREADALTFENLHLSTRIDRLDCGIRVRPYEALPAVSITFGGVAPEFNADPVWYRNLEYRMDLDRGYDGHEDNWSPGGFRIPCSTETELVVACTIGEPVADPVALWKEASGARRAHYRTYDGTLRSWLSLEAGDFLYTAEDGRTGVIAGWPWFQEWGRDTFIALPGLTLARGQVEECGKALAGALRYLRSGLLPNIFGRDVADSHYGSVDASLWFARAVRLYELAGGAPDLVREVLLPALFDIANHYRDGTDLEVRCDGGGLIRAGSERLNSTWMDAQVAEGPVTPRHGYAVEINALWYFLLEYLERVCTVAGDTAGRATWGDLRGRAERSFLERFWLPDGRYLADCWNDGIADRSVRPNMVIAAALEFSPLTRGKRTDIVAQAEVELLTPRGLRTLAPKNPNYKGRYQGDQRTRDLAYHQGTVWPWLLGFFCEAYLRAFGHDQRQRDHLRHKLDAFAEHVGTQGLGHVSEVFDGDPPHRPGGTIAQAWSTAELLRAYQLLESFPS